MMPIGLVGTAAVHSGCWQWHCSALPIIHPKKRDISGKIVGMQTKLGNTALRVHFNVTTSTGIVNDQRFVGG